MARHGRSLGGYRRLGARRGQLRECKEYAQRNGITILGSYVDRALSAKTDNRPDFQRMIEDNTKDLFDRVQSKNDI